MMACFTKTLKDLVLPEGHQAQSQSRASQPAVIQKAV